MISIQSNYDLARHGYDGAGSVSAALMIGAGGGAASGQKRFAFRKGGNVECLFNCAGRAPLLRRRQEYRLGLQIQRYRRALNRMLLRDIRTVEHITALVRKWQTGRLRIDGLCEVALKILSREINLN